MEQQTYNKWISIEEVENLAKMSGSTLEEEAKRMQELGFFIIDPENKLKLYTL